CRTMFTNATALTPKTGGAHQALFALILTFSPREKERPSDLLNYSGSCMAITSFGGSKRWPCFSPSPAPPPLKLGRAGRRERAGVRVFCDYLSFSKPDWRPKTGSKNPDLTPPRAIRTRPNTSQYK